MGWFMSLLNWHDLLFWIHVGPRQDREGQQQQQQTDVLFVRPEACGLKRVEGAVELGFYMILTLIGLWSGWGEGV